MTNIKPLLAEADIEENGKTEFSFFGHAPITLVRHFAACADRNMYAHVWFENSEFLEPTGDEHRTNFMAVGGERFMNYCIALIEAHNAA